MDDQTDIGPRLRELRGRAGFSHSQLAKRAGVHPMAISKLERGGRDPRLSTVVRLARALDVRPSELIDDEVTSPPSGRGLRRAG